MERGQTDAELLAGLRQEIGGLKPNSNDAWASLTWEAFDAADHGDFDEARYRLSLRELAAAKYESAIECAFARRAKLPADVKSYRLRPEYISALRYYGRIGKLPSRMLSL